MLTLSAALTVVVKCVPQHFGNNLHLAQTRLSAPPADKLLFVAENLTCWCKIVSRIL
jgi:hypothetical protein